MQTPLFSPTPGPPSAATREGCGIILRPNTGARWDRRPSEPGLWKVTGRRPDGRYLAVPCDSSGAIDKQATPEPVSAAWQAWLLRPAPVMP